MALRNQPYLPLYVNDFLTDEKLNRCSYQTKGVYISIMCLLHKSEKYGTILLKQKDKQSNKQVENFALVIAQNLPYKKELFDIILNSLEELISEDVIQINDDCLSQKRMVKDNEISEKRAVSGSKGGKVTQKKGTIFDYSFALDFALANYQANSEYENINEYINEIINKTIIEFDIKDDVIKKELNKQIKSKIKQLDKKNNDAKHKYGQYKKVLLTDKQYNELLNLYGSELEPMIKILDTYCESSGKTYKNYLSVLKSWVRDRYEKDKKGKTYQQQKSATEMLSEVEIDEFGNILTNGKSEFELEWENA